jgi:succinoglycan biosynthesis protein ExoM
VVVDNDEERRAERLVTQLSAELRLDVTYSVEKERTIATVRNHALTLAKGNLIGIIDDDEFPTPTWLLRMHEALEAFDVDGVVGPVYPYFAATPPSWLVKSGVCQLPVHKTGTLLQWSQIFTNNVLIKREVFDEHGLRFDRTFRTGGSDQDFFRRAMTHGYTFVAVKEAAVYETIPQGRWTRSHWTKRALVNGANAWKYAANMSPSRRLIVVLKSAVGACAYATALPICVCLGRHRSLQCIEKCFYHFSRLCSSFGLELWTKRDF